MERPRDPGFNRPVKPSPKDPGFNRPVKPINGERPDQIGKVYTGGSKNFDETTGKYKPGTGPELPKPHAAPSVPNRAGAYRGQAINAGTNYRPADSLNPNAPKASANSRLGEATSRTKPLSSFGSSRRDLRLDLENNLRNTTQETNSLNHYVKTNTRAQRTADYNAQPTQPKNGATTFKGDSVVGGVPRIGARIAGGIGGALGFIPTLLEGGKIMSGQNNPNYIPKSQREG
jgi:hypothetical protein